MSDGIEITPATDENGGLTPEFARALRGEPDPFDLGYVYFTAWSQRDDGSLCYCLTCQHVRRTLVPPPAPGDPS